MNKLFVILLILLTPGCATEYNIATQQEDLIYYDTDREVKIGASVCKAVEKEFKPVEDPLIQDRVAKIGAKIAAVSDRKDINYSFKVLEDDEVNAFALPGGYVYCFRGLVDKVANDDQLAGVLAHEVGHIVAKHSIKKLQTAMGYNLFSILVAQTVRSGELSRGMDLAVTQIFMGYSRKDELQADSLGVKYNSLAGYNPRAMIDFLHILDTEYRKKPLRGKSYFRTHPFTPDRVRVIKQELGEGMSFSEYINIDDQPYSK